MHMARTDRAHALTCSYMPLSLGAEQRRESGTSFCAGDQGHDLNEEEASTRAKRKAAQSAGDGPAPARGGGESKSQEAPSRHGSRLTADTELRRCHGSALN